MTTGAPGYRRFHDLPPDELQVLRERARRLAPVPQAGSTGDEVEVLEIHSRGQSFALPLAAVEGVMELASVAALPQAPASVRGLVSFRGEVLVAFELSSLVGGGNPGIVDLRRVVAVSAGGRKLALLTERVLTVRTALVSAFKPIDGARFAFLVGADATLVSLLDPGGLVTHALGTLQQGRS